MAQSSSVRIDSDGVKIGAMFHQFAIDECEGCRFMKHLGCVDGVTIDRDVCMMRPEDEDKLLFGNMPEDQIPDCMLG